MDITPKKPIDAQTFRAKLEGKSGKQYWRSLEELADTPEFREYLRDEIPQHTRSFDLLSMDRRRFLTLAGASLALAGLSGCRWLPAKRVVPAAEQSEDRVISVANLYATAVVEHGLATGVLVTSNEGRPTRIEGNPEHPATLGGSSSTVQATLLDLYDPDRAQSVINEGSISTWPAFLDTVRNALVQTKDGTGLRILTETVTSPTLTHQIKELLKAYPQAKWHQYEPCGRDNVVNGAKAAFGQPVNTLYDFSKADRILSLDADFLLSMPGHIRYSRDFATKRRIRTADIAPDQPKKMEMNRLYMVESSPSITGTMADHRLPLRASQVESLARAVATALGVDAGGGDLPAGVSKVWFDALIADLKTANGSSIVITGDHQPPAVHVLCHAINAALGNVGKTVTYTDAIETQPVDQLASLRELVDDHRKDSSSVRVLLILGGNPAYTAPADFAIDRLIQTTPLTAHLSLHENETSALCKWTLPEAHPMEAWSDARAYDGTLSIIQPLIAPLYEGARSILELVASLTGAMPASYDLVYDYWKSQKPAPDFEKWWQQSLHDGLVQNSAYPAKTFPLNPAAAKATVTAPTTGQGLELLLLPDPTIRDGRFSNNGWMQELPKPLTKLTWDNAALMSQATAEKLGLAPAIGGLTVADEKMVEFTLGAYKLKIPVLVLPGHPDDAVTIHLGYGRTHTGKIGTGTGFNGYLLRSSTAPYFAGGMKAAATGETYPLAHTRSHHSMEGRDILMEATLEEFLKKPDFAKTEATINPETKEGDDKQSAPADSGEGKRLSLYDPQDHEYKQDGAAYAYNWGLSIDNNVCIGCNACVTACQNENNIPIVGKDQVQRGREMHWIRIDRYYRGPVSNPHTFFEPVTCMHCENAPCEPVCPVAATVHSHEGMNQMIYNRCVGTRYCSNNCPYKVRRFNFYKYTAGQPDPDKLNGNNDSPVLQLLSNPDVTVRGRGVMEKCTYCVQRVNHARIAAKKEGRAIKDGEVVTACQQSCPTQAIVFGDVGDKNTLVAKLKAQPTDYSMLGELNTRPRTTYLARLRNPNPAIKEDVEEKSDTPVVE